MGIAQRMEQIEGLVVKNKERIFQGSGRVTVWAQSLTTSLLGARRPYRLTETQCIRLSLAAPFGRAQARREIVAD